MTDHVSEPDGRILGVILHQRVVVCGEQCTATDLL